MSMDVEGFTPRTRETAPCTCMFHWGETAQTACTLDPTQTARNVASLARAA